jgi:hypothetical protein
MIQNENFTWDNVKKSSCAAANLAQWVIDMVGGKPSSEPVEEVIRQESPVKALPVKKPKQKV